MEQTPVRKTFFLSVGKQNVGWKKNCQLGEKCRLENAHCQKRKCPDIPWNARPKNGRGWKNPPRAYSGGKSWELYFVGWREKMSVGKKCVGGGKADAHASPCAGERLIAERGDYSFAALLCDRVPSSGGIPCYQVRHLLVFWLRVGPLAPLTCPADTHLYTRGVFEGLFSLVTFSVFI